MTPILRRLLAFIAIQFIGAVAWAGQPPTRASHVILISFDGLRPDAIYAAGASTLQSLIRGGAATLRCMDELPSATLPNHASMVTGKPVIEHGVIANWDLPGCVGVPTIFDIATKAGRHCAFFASKTKFTFLCRPRTASPRLIETNIDKMTDAIIKTFHRGMPDLTFIHFNEPDGAGHSRGWMSADYLTQVRRVDSLLHRILAELQRDGTMDSTCIIITADHGGIGNNHARDIPEIRHVPLILFGAGVHPGAQIQKQMNVRNVAAISLYLLGIELPQGWGERIPMEVLIASGSAEPAIRAASTPSRSNSSWYACLSLVGAGSLLILVSHRRR